MVEHMKSMRILRPKFEAVLETLDRELEGLGIGTWTTQGRCYFIAFDSLDVAAKSHCGAKCKKAGLVMTRSRSDLSIWKRSS